VPADRSGQVKERTFISKDTRAQPLIASLGADTLFGEEESGMERIDKVGETTITGKNQVSLPARGLRLLGWDKGDHLIVKVLGDDMMVLVRRPASWTEAFAGRLGHIFGTHEENLGYIEEERRSWDEE
jgi:bifunctional DNA-binding transcriptional regulator/antitoxin component of YhaV-PrlF toxin-antitoxin module